MTCRDFERIWNELLDSERVAGDLGHCARTAKQNLVECEYALLEHAAECAACALVSARYQVLQRAIQAWGPPIGPSAGLADRILAEFQAPASNAWGVKRPAGRKRLWPAAGLAGIAAAAIVWVIALPALNRSIDRRQRGSQVVASHNTPVNTVGGSAMIAVDSRALNVAFAQATAATWDLARSASEPAARISRDVIDAATTPEQAVPEPRAVTGSEPASATVSVPSLGSLVPDTAAAGAMLQQVGDRLTLGVRPLSDTARHAFGFLLGTTPSKPEAPVNPPAQKGA